jgi:uncharacterized protein HemY
MRRARGLRRDLGYSLVAVSIGLIPAAVVVSGVVPGIVFNQNVELHQAQLAGFLLALAVVAALIGVSMLLKLDRQLPWVRRRKRRRSREATTLPKNG